jgi:hypothetical protein
MGSGGMTPPKATPASGTGPGFDDRAEAATGSRPGERILDVPELSRATGVTPDTIYLLDQAAQLGDADSRAILAALGLLAAESVREPLSEADEKKRLMAFAESLWFDARWAGRVFPASYRATSPAAPDVK